MIKSIKHKGLKKLYLEGKTAGVQQQHVAKLTMLLARLNGAETIDDMNFPNAHLHLLRHNLQNHWSVRVSANWRLTFQFIDGNAYVVDYQDYH